MDSETTAATKAMKKFMLRGSPSGSVCDVGEDVDGGRPVQKGDLEKVKSFALAKPSLHATQIRSSGGTMVTRVSIHYFRGIAANMLFG